MFKKLAVAAVSALAAFALVVSTATAQTVKSSIEVRVGLQAVDFCMASSTELSYRLKFTAKVKTNGVPFPNKIRVAYQLLDKTANMTLGSRAINLRKSAGYAKKSRRVYAPVGHKMQYRVKFTYHAYGRTLGESDKFADEIPTTEELFSLGVPGC